MRSLIAVKPGSGGTAAGFIDAKNWGEGRWRSVADADGAVNRGSCPDNRVLCSVAAVQTSSQCLHRIELTRPP